MSKNVHNILFVLFCCICLLIHGIATITGGIILIQFIFHTSFIATLIIWLGWIVLSIFIILFLDQL